MIRGTVRAREGRVNLKVHGARGQQREIEAVIDTGYTASLSLPPPLISALGLRWNGFVRGVLADGSESLFDVYVAKVIWDGKERRILVAEADSEVCFPRSYESWYLPLNNR